MSHKNFLTGPLEMTQRRIGKTDLMVTPICIGTSPLASMPKLYGYSVDEARAIDTVRAFFASPLNFLDTSNNYGEGRAEVAIGKAIRQLGKVPDGVVIATKVDADAAGDFSGERVRRSAQESLERLGLDRFDLLHLHDPDRVMSFGEGTKAGGALETLVVLKEEGLASNIGIATGDLQALDAYLGTGVFDVLLSHNRYTLIDRTANFLIEKCNSQGVGFLNAAPYGGGILARGSKASTRYAYAEADPAVLSLVQDIEALCSRYEVPLPSAALQFSLRDSRIASTVLGVSSPARIEETIQLAGLPIPPEFWEEVETRVSQSS